jgi:CRP/FNR family transcriptional regulator
MISTDDLKKFKIFSELTDSELEKINIKGHPGEFEADSIIFKEGEPAEHVYFLISGKILLEQRITSEMTVTVDTLKSGDTLGTAAIMGIHNYTMDANVAETSELLIVNAHEFSTALAENPDIGFKILKSLCLEMKKQVTERTELFVRSISNHPDFDEFE